MEQPLGQERDGTQHEPLVIELTPHRALQHLGEHWKDNALESRRPHLGRLTAHVGVEERALQRHDRRVAHGIP